MQARKLAVSLILIGVVAIVAQSGAAAPSTAPQSATGAIVAVDAAARTLTIHGKHGDQTFVWDDATSVIGRKSPAYLKAGSSVTVQYTPSSAGARKAQRITVNPPPKRAMEQG
jgi:hypothetical protein